MVGPGCPAIAVADGEIVELERDDEGCEIETENGQLEIEAPGLTLQVTATDAAGNTATAAVPASGLGADNDDDTATTAEVDD